MISRVSESPKLLRLKTVPKLFLFYGHPWNLLQELRRPRQLCMRDSLSLSLNLQGASRVANPGVAQNWVSSRENFNPRSSEATKAAQDLQVAQFRGPKVAQIEVIPRKYFILRSIRNQQFVMISGWRRIEVFPRENSILSNFRMCKVTQVEVFHRGN